MMMTAREAFEKHTEACNARDLGAFAELLAEDVVFHAPGEMVGHGKAGCLEFDGGWIKAFPDAHVEISGFQVIDDVGR